MRADGGRGVVVAGDGVGAPSAAHEFTRTVLVVCFVIVVARRFVGATKRDAGEVIAGSIVDGRRRVVVASKGVGAPCTRVEVAAAIQLSGILIVVARCFVGATLDFKGVTHAIAVGVEEAVAIAVVSRVGKFTRCRVDGLVVVVAGRRAQTPCTRSKLAAAVANIGIHVEIARCGVLASRHCSNARSIVVGRIAVKVQGGGIRAAVHFVCITHAIAVGVFDAIPIAVVPRIRIFT